MLCVDMSELDDLTAAAILLEEAAPYSPEAERTVTRVVDRSTNWGPRPNLTLYPRVRLLVYTSYGKKGDELVGYGNHTALENNPPKPHVRYTVMWEEFRLPLLRPQAEALLETGDLPAEVVEGLRARQRERAMEIDMGDPLEGLSNDHRKDMMGHGRFGVAPGA